jgi:hypothetical protein
LLTYKSLNWFLPHLEPGNRGLKFPYHGTGSWILTGVISVSGISTKNVPIFEIVLLKYSNKKIWEGGRGGGEHHQFLVLLLIYYKNCYFKQEFTDS